MTLNCLISKRKFEMFQKPFPIGTCGILITTHLKKEFKASSECLLLFQEYLKEEMENSNGIGIENELEMELKALKNNNSLEFIHLPKEIDCIRFCKTTGVDPVLLVKDIITHLKTTKIKKTRFTQRMLPIQVTCGSTFSIIFSKLEELLEKSHISKESEASSFKIILKSRLNTKLSQDKDLIIQKIANLVNEKHKVYLSGSNNVILVYILQKITFISVISDYQDFCTFNLESIPLE